MIANLTETLRQTESETERRRAVISGKRDLMQLLVEKTLEYMRVIDPQAEIVLQEMATQYETLIDQCLALNGDASIVSGAGGRSDAAAARQLRDKDREIKRLQRELTQQ